MASTKFIAPAILAMFALLLRQNIFMNHFSAKNVPNNGLYYTFTHSEAIPVGFEALLATFSSSRFRESTTLFKNHNHQLKFLIALLLACGDIQTNPGPITTYACEICAKRIESNDTSI